MRTRVRNIFRVAFIKKKSQRKDEKENWDLVLAWLKGQSAYFHRVRSVVLWFYKQLAFMLLAFKDRVTVCNIYWYCTQNAYLR